MNLGPSIILGLIIALFQTALIHYQHFSPFEREMNLRSVLWGAKPGARYWAILALDICVGLLIALLALSILPMSPRDEPMARVWRFIPAWIVVSLFAAVTYSYLNSTIIRFPNYGLIARRGIVLAIMSIALVAATLFAVSVAMTTDSVGAVDVWTRALPLVIVLALGVALAAFVARSLAFFLRILPILGSFLHAFVSTFLLVWAIEQFGRIIIASAPIGPTWRINGWDGMASAGFTLSALAGGAFIAAWLLREKKNADAVEPPALVNGQESTINSKASARITDKGATLASSNFCVEITHAPFSAVVKNAQGEMLWQLAENGLSRDWVVQKIIAIPLLYTGNTMKMNLGAFSQTVNWSNSQLVAESQDTALAVTCHNASLRFSFHGPDILRVEFKHSSSVLRHSSLRFNIPDDAHILGLGQRFNKIDQRGEETYFVVEEGGVGYEWMKQRAPWLYPIFKKWFGARGSFPNGEQCTGFPVPFALIAREKGASTGLFWNTYQPSWFTSDERRMTGDEGRSASVVRPSSSARLTILDNHLNLFLCAGPKPLDVIQQYASLTGKSATPPPWVFLPWKTNTGAVVEDDVRTDIRKFRELEIPLAQVGIEHWQEIRGSYEFSKNWWRNIDNLIQTARDNGYRVHIWHFPYMNAGSATHREGVRRGFFIKNRLGLPYHQRIFHGIATVVDYTNPRASAWHEKIVARTFHERGIQGVMTDYAESIPPDSVFYNGQPGIAMRNAYPVIYCQAMQRAARSVHGDDHLLYPRAGYAGSQRFVAAQWPGDQDTDWDDGDGLPAAVRAMMNASICGFPVHGSDVGGWYDWFAPITTKELYLRWAEVGCYSPLMRAHGGPIGRNREPWKFDDETIEIYRALSEEHVKLFPYGYSLSKQATRDGTPIIRHPALMWSDCAELYGIEDSWMIGDALYVAPVIQPGTTKRTVLLPPGDWWSLNDGRAVQGLARIEVDAPLGKTPVFLRRGFIVPRFARAFDTFDATMNGKSGSLNDDIEAWIYPSESKASFELFDGTILKEGEQPRNRKVEWKVFGA